nr:RNA polymerase recycling motor HelD [Bacillus licheniformis]
MKSFRKCWGKQADIQMKSIVATIQKEQNQIIRNEKSRFLIVRGGGWRRKNVGGIAAGPHICCTACAGQIESSQMSLFSPNLLFNSYVANVLPELGEENIQQTTFQEFVARRLGKQVPCETPFDQLEYCLTASDGEEQRIRMKSIELKSSLAFKGIIDDYVKYLAKGNLVFKHITFRGKRIITSGQMRKFFAALDHSDTLSNRIEQTGKWLLRLLNKYERQERKKDWVIEESESLDKEEYLKAYKRLQEEQRFTENTFDDYERERNLLASIVAEREFKPLKQVVKAFGFIDFKGTYLQLFSGRYTPKTRSDDWQSICTFTQKSFRFEKPLYEDAVPFLYMKNKLKGGGKNTAIRHLFIDEAQDYTPFQLAFLESLFPACEHHDAGRLKPGDSCPCLSR